MAGIFSKSNRPIPAGAYVNFQPSTQAPVYAGTSGIVAMAFSHNWGPENVATRYNNVADWVNVNGRNQATSGNVAVDQVFKGEGIPGASGADRLIGYRMVNTATAVKASLPVRNATVVAFTLTAIYYGTYGNRLTASVIPNAKNPATMNDLVIYDNNIEVERWPHLLQDLTTLVASLNARSSWVRASGLAAALATPVIASVTPSATGGTLAAGTYYYVVTAINANGETLPSANEVSATTTGATGSIVLTWGAVTGATGYRVYRGTASGAETVYYVVGAVTTYTDINAASTAGTPPVANTTASTALVQTVSANLIGGANGTLTPTDYAAATAALATQRFSVFCLDDVAATTAAVLATILAWSQGLNNTGKRFMSVVGGALDETIAAATARSASLNDPNFVNVGVGSVTDNIQGLLSTSQLAPRIAGIIARRADTRNLTFARLAGATITPASAIARTDIVTAIQSGVVVISRDSREDVPTRIEKGITTFTNVADANRPLNVFSGIKYLRTMQILETELTDFAEQFIIGQMPINDATRGYLKTRAINALKLREDAGIVQPGWSVDIDNQPPPQVTDEFIALAVTLNFGRSLEQIYYTITVG